MREPRAVGPDFVAVGRLTRLRGLMLDVELEGTTVFNCFRPHLTDHVTPRARCLDAWVLCRHWSFPH